MIKWLKSKFVKSGDVSSANINSIVSKETNNDNTSNNEPRTLGELAKETNHTFWKFCQSQKGRSCEPHFAKYEVGKITTAECKDKMLSFVNNTTIASCYLYGDTLAKFVFDNSNPVFQTISDYPIKYVNSILGEYETEKLLTEKLYSLEKIETIRLIFELTTSNKDLIGIFAGYGEKNLERCLKEYGYFETSDLLNDLTPIFNSNLNGEFEITKEKILNKIDEYQSDLS